MVKVVGDLSVRGCIGRGSTSSVRLGVHRVTGAACAVKVMAKSVISSEAVSAEVRAWRAVQDCPGVLQLREVHGSERYWCVSRLDSSLVHSQE